MKIACICNMNNIMFALTRYLRDRGHNAELILFEGEFEHFSPSMDTFDDSYTAYTKQSPWSNMPSQLHHTNKRDIRALIDEYDFVFGCGSTPAYFHKGDIQLDVMIPYGSDIDSLPFFKVPYKALSKTLRYYNLSRHQKKGIMETKYIWMSHTNEQWENIFQELDINAKRLKIPCPFIYSPQYKLNEQYREVSKLYSRFKSIRDNCDLMVFSHARHEWATYEESNPSNKGNDKLIRGFAKFVQSNKGTKAKLLLFEYGADVEKSKTLIKDLGISDAVEWFPISPRKEIIMGIEQSDVVVGNLNTSFLTYGIACEALAVGTPIMHNRDDTMYGDYKELYPMLNAFSDETVAEGLQQLADNKEHYKGVGKRGQDWFERYMVEYPLAVIDKLLAGELQEPQKINVSNYEAYSNK